MRIASFAVFAAVALTGCSATNSIGTMGTAFEWSAAKKVQVGTTDAEIVALLGKPRMIKTLPNGEEVWIWAYANGFTGLSGNVSFALQGGRVIRLPAGMDQFG